LPILKIAFQGERGAFSETAAKKLFGKDIDISPSFSFEEVFIKVKKEKVNYGVVPIENSLYGSIFETYDLLFQNSLTIVGEINLQINHYLLSSQNYKLDQIKKVYSHPQALGQCSVFLKTLKNARLVPAYDTAGSALISLNDKNSPSAAVASREAADIYKLKILKSNIQNNKENFTRFLAISRGNAGGKFIKPKTSMCFELKSMPGALFRALSVFALRDIDLVKIESRPIPHKPFEYFFYVDLKGSLTDKKIKNAINHLSEISHEVRIFGTYESGKIFKS
jgi:prephenate dehydratase